MLQNAALAVLACSLLVGDFAHADARLPIVVAIDPGHGGSNTGAAGRVPGRFEKHLTLAIARALRARLERDGARVVLTRDHDQYLTLRERARRANAAKPDCFISLHANAAPDHSRHGVETYVLARESVDVDARRRAARASDDVARMLAELSQLDVHKRSVGLAHAVERELLHATGASDRGVRQAAYDVLDGVEAPAILVEVGFIDHPIEGVKLQESETQAKIADAIADAIEHYFAMQQTRVAAR